MARAVVAHARRQLAQEQAEMAGPLDAVGYVAARLRHAVARQAHALEVIEKRVQIKEPVLARQSKNLLAALLFAVGRDLFDGVWHPGLRMDAGDEMRGQRLLILGEKPGRTVLGRRAKIRDHHAGHRVAGVLVHARERGQPQAIDPDQQAAVQALNIISAPNASDGSLDGELRLAPGALDLVRRDQV